MPVPPHLEFFIDPSRCIGCQACVQACSECDTHKGESMIHLEYVDRGALGADGARGLHALRAADLRRGLPRRRDQAHRRRRGAERAQAALHRLRQLRAGCPFGVPELYIDRSDHDEVRHVLRPHFGRQEADVRDGLPEPGALLRHAREISALRPQSTPTNTFRFGDQTITTRVNVMVPKPAGAPAHDRRDRGDGRAPAEPHGAAAGGGRDDPTPSPRWRSEPWRTIRRGASRRISRSTRASTRPKREGLTGTARADVYGPTRDPDDVTVAARRPPMASSRGGGRTSRSTGRRITTSRAATSRSSWC
jgi:ferredoxin